MNTPTLPTAPLEPLAPSALNAAEISSVIAMAWSDDTPFEAIALQFGLSEGEVIDLMRAQLKARSFRVWRMRVRGRAAKHASQQGAVLRHSLRPCASDLNAITEDGAAAEFPTRSQRVSRDSLA